MSLNQFIVDSINQSTIEVFSTMLSVEMTPGVASSEGETPDASCEVVAFIGIAGPWAGTGSLSCSAALACRACTNMLMTEASTVNEEVLDAMAELTNMVIGNVKTLLESQLGPLGLSIPTVVYGRNFKTKTAGTADWIVLRFHWDEDFLTVKLRMTPNDKDARHPIHFKEKLAGILEPAVQL
jgi:chemotaxis protein CheX